MKPNATIARYKGKGRWFDKAVRFWTRPKFWSLKSGKYSHTELIIDGVWYSSSQRDNGARTKRIDNPVPDHWDFEPVLIDKPYALKVFQEHKGKGYDNLGILLSQFIHLGIHSKSKVWCTELVAEMCGDKNAHRKHPNNF